MGLFRRNYPLDAATSDKGELNKMNLPNINFKLLSTRTEKELKDIVESSPLTPCFIVYFRYKYTHDTKWEYMINTCALYNCDDILWFNDWYEGQEDIEYLAVAAVEVPKNEIL